MGEEMHSIHSDLDYVSMRPACADSPYTPHKVDKMRRHLRFHFMTPCEKFKARGRKPWKLVIQLFKILIVTLQVYSLGVQRSNFVEFQHKTKTSLEHILFQGWDAAYETMPYPAATGKYALYKVEDVVDHLNYAMRMYNQTDKLAIGAYGYPESQRKLPSKSGQLKLLRFKVGKIFPGNATYDLDPTLAEEIINFTSVKLDNGTEEYDILGLLRTPYDETLSIRNLHSMELSLVLNTIHLKMKGMLNLFSEPDCLHINVTINYDNSKHNGQMPVRMLLDLSAVHCNDGSQYDRDSELEQGLTMALDIAVIMLCTVSFITCCRSLQKSLKLMRKSREFFLKHYDYVYDWDDIMMFSNLWFVMIIVSDILTVTGSGMKIALTYHDYKYYDHASMLLGISIILIWMGVMRYFEYFKKYNVLVLTCKKALPDVLRFLTCASIFYIAYTICGWLVLGPYHVKFVTIGTSSECLFSLVNGDDMFVTFSVIDDRVPSAIWFFSRVYLYSFISLFIYFVLNVFISVIIDTYEVVKKYYSDEVVKSFVEKFIFSCEDGPTSPLYSSDLQRKGCGICCCLSSCISRNHNDDSVNILG